MTRKEWFLKYLPKDIAEKAIANTLNLRGEVRLNESNIEGFVILGAFAWDESPEGQKFWEEVNEKYAIAGLDKFQEALGLLREFVDFELTVDFYEDVEPFIDFTQKVRNFLEKH